MTLENLAQIGKLKPHKTTREEIARLLAAVRRNLKDAKLTSISPESRFDIAYKAVMQCGLIAAMANGFLAPGMEMVTKPFAVDALAARIRDMINA